MTRIAIIGGGLSGKLAALYLSQHVPDANLIMVDPNAKDLPVVGESTVEVTSQFLASLGLSSYLEENHLHKYGLTYYFRLPKQDGMGFDYVRHESPGVKRINAYNLNRHTFDAELDRRVAGKVTRISGKAQEVVFADGEPTGTSMMDARNKNPVPKGTQPQIVKIMTTEGDMLDVAADHVIDCSGRARILAKQLNLQKAAPVQRCSYWFRLEAFDREILTKMPVVKDQQLSFDSYYVTHHFYGKGYWIWIIPMKSETGQDMVSIGITYRPDVSGEKAMNMDRMLEILGRDHPHLADLVRSGRKVDESRYFNYMYEAEQYYDRQGRWFMLGDSGFTFDPANSAGIAYLSVQIPQITSMIKKAGTGLLSPAYISALEGHMSAQLSLQDEWSDWYKVMDDPIKMAWTLLLSQFGYFVFTMPNYLSGAFLNAGVARQSSRVLKRYDPGMRPPVYPFPKILDRLAMTDDAQEIIRRIPSYYDRVLPFSYFRPDNVSRGRMMARYLLKSAWLRTEALRLLKWWKDPSSYGLAVTEYGKSALQVLGAGVLTLRPQLWDRSKSKAPALASAFEPEQAFLFPSAQSNSPVVDAPTAPSDTEGQMAGKPELAMI